jgi:CBS domain-containing protein/gamma-glutamylcysteine synthetase
MGEEIQTSECDAEELQRFTQHLLIDLRALEKMIEESWIESDIVRIGAEQEAFLVDDCWRPALANLKVLADLADDERFTSELGQFNLEFNLDPVEFSGRCLSELSEQLEGLIGRAREAAAQHGAEIVLTGILPTLLKSDLGLDAMTPKLRYYALNEAMNRLRGEQYQFRIKGRDEVIISHDNVMLEACNTSFQVHLQVSAEDFAEQYNIAQLVGAPVLAVAANSPLLFGRQLWAETRIALFQQSVDTRRSDLLEHRRQEPRVSFGRRWLDESVTEIFREDIARFRVVLGRDRSENALEEVRAGRVPELWALRLHNGTVYRWNRPCYGISNGRPHLRIENRLLPAGPSGPDEIANAAFWLGLMVGVRAEYGDLRSQMPFEDVRDNFVAAARLGLRAQFAWPGRGRTPASELILDELVPMARAGLVSRAVDTDDIDHYLGIIQARAETGRTGARWLGLAMDAVAGTASSNEVSALVVASLHAQQTAGRPVHQWEAPTVGKEKALREHYRSVGQLMSTDLFTVNEDEPIDLAAHVMDWKHIRHVPVEDSDNRLVGLVSHRALVRLMARALTEGLDRTVLVGEVMARQVVTVNPETATLEAFEMMKRHQVSCLPVVDQNHRLVGIITERDFMGISGRLLERFLGGGDCADLEEDSE